MLKKVFVICVLSFLFAGCSTNIFEGTPPAVKEVLIGVSNRYLGLIAAGQEKQVVELVYWPDFSDNGDLTLDDFHKQFSAIKGRWPLTPQEHPLLGLKVVDASANGNFGEVRLTKDPKYVTAGSKSQPDIRIKFIWAGNGWVIREDSLFGKGKFLSQYVS